MRLNGFIRSRAAIGACVCLVGSAVFAGCGDNGNSTGTSESGGSSPLRIAVFANETGKVVSGEQRVRPVLEAWATARNKAGGVAGHPVEFAFQDTKGDAATAASQGNEVAREDGIVAAISFDANAEGIYADKLVRAGVPVIGGMGYDPRVWGAKPNWLSVSTNFPSIINAAMVLAKTTGAKRPSYAVCAEVATCEGIGALAEQASGKLGLSYAGTVKLAAASPDFTAECLNLEKQNVDFVALGHAASVDLRLAASCKTQGFAGRYAMSSGSVEPAILKKDDPGVRIDIALNAFPWFVDDKPVKAYRELMTSAGVPDDAWGDPRGSAAYATMELFAKTIERNSGKIGSSPTREKVVEAYGTVRDETLDGLLPQPVSFTPGKPAPLVSCYWLGHYENGRFEGSGLKPTCDPNSLK